MLSHLELRHLFESAFLPTECKCTVSSDRTISIQLINPRTRKVEVSRSAVPISGLTSSRAIANLVAELKEELRIWPIAHQDLRHNRR
ncbi:DUF1652 domain-containing protein [Pseudomonas coleopterorum]|uniref:DUF1652 domain-containing protein n=1 Tax=Pseudomonas coleopterorum TaxID=1605838 RepID=UPI00177C0AF0|nr:DUF1652 domain-containing protein [Pseudomonas coleopterorum]MBD8480391.1 DUF1652 domain-containing protein [Pseudomonas coleopterorum]